MKDEIRGRSLGKNGVKSEVSKVEEGNVGRVREEYYGRGRYQLLY